MSAHCWHNVAGVVLDCNPPIVPIVCCHCGIHGQAQASREFYSAPGHGQFITTPRMRYSPTTECEKAPAPAPTAEISFWPICQYCGTQMQVAHFVDGKRYVTHAVPDPWDKWECPLAGKKFKLPTVQVEEIL